MFLVRCIPIVGTAVTAFEAVGALIDGDGTKFVSKLAQTAVGGVMDAAFIMSGGASSLITAPIKGSAVEGGKIVGKKAIEELLVREAGNLVNVGVRAVTQVVIEKATENSGGYYSQSSGGYYFQSGGKMSGLKSSEKNNTSDTGSSGGGSDPPNYPKLPKEHEMDDDDYDDYDRNLGPLDQRNHPITYIRLGRNGRVEDLNAAIRKKNLRSRGAPRRNITSRVKRFVDALGRVKDSRNSGTRESDEVGHIIADSLGGPHDQTYNFFPQSPFCNMKYYHRTEREIYDFLESTDGEGRDVFVVLFIKLKYVDYYTGVSPNRPRSIEISTHYSNGKSDRFELSNM